MANKINITDKLSFEKPTIVIENDTFEVNDSADTMFKFQELALQGTKDSLEKAIGIALGEEGAKKIDLGKWSMKNLKILIIAIMAAISGISYEEAEERFRSKE